MTRLLFIQASPRKADSASLFSARHFLAALQAKLPTLSVETLDLWAAELPEFEGAMLAAKYARLARRDLNAPEQAAWRIIEGMIARLAGADLVLIATPMWNFGIPYKLKHWIDLVTQPGLSFSFDPATGYTPLLRSRPTLAILASAGNYSEGPSRGRPDLATPYLKAALGFIGLADAIVVGQGPTIGPDQKVAEGRAHAHARLEEIAASFATTVGVGAERLRSAS
ncbi:FMN-dependent NADH-azoreductase [Bosea sp. 2KB_26]|uniref:FMN-dependent NADH-azoreductase n=1 Tax=Bosea sp. 2KB_26 TaxID=3237475 RepID=UPI000DE4FD93